jgi:hypothetical protein
MFIILIAFMGGCGIKNNGGIVDNGHKPPVVTTVPVDGETIPDPIAEEKAALSRLGYKFILDGAFAVQLPGNLLPGADLAISEFRDGDLLIRFSIIAAVCENSLSKIHTENDFFAYQCSEIELNIAKAGLATVKIEHNLPEADVENIVKSFKAVNPPGE